MTSGTPALPALRPGANGPQLGVRLTPSAPRTRVGPVYGDRLKVAVSAPPEDNRANAELVDTLAGWLGLRRDSVHLESGHASRDKVVSFSGIDEAELRSRLAALLSGGLRGE